MVLGESDRGPGSSELKPALMMAEIIHTKNSYVDLYQHGLYPGMADGFFAGTNIQFEHHDPSNSETIWGMGDVDHVRYSHRISFGSLEIKGRLVDPVGSIVIGLDGIVRFISQDNSFFLRDDNDHEMPPDTIVSLADDRATKKFIAKLTNNFQFESEEENTGLRNPTTPETVEQLKKVVERYSAKNKKLESEIVLGGYRYNVASKYIDEQPKSVTVTRTREQKKDHKQYESWSFSPDMPTSYTTYSNPKFDIRNSAETIRMQMDLIIANMKSLDIDDEIGASVAVNNEVSRGVQVLSNLAHSKRASYVKSSLRRLANK